jgi:PAS domain S-box-containing protein
LGMSEHLCSYWAEELHKVFESGVSNWTVEFDFDTPSGQKYFQSYLVPEFAEDGSVKTVLAISRDVTDRKRAELKLKETLADIEERVRLKTAQLQWVNNSLKSEIAERKQAEEALRDREETERALINASNEALLLIDTQGIILTANEALARRWGKTVHEIIGTCQYDYFPPDVAEDRRKRYDTVAATGKSAHFVDTRDGMMFDTYCNPIFDGEGRVTRIAIFALDITQRTKAQEDNTRLESTLRQSQKMEAIGALAGGVAHDFNNILTAIIGYGSLLQMGMERSDPMSIYVDQILASSQKAAHLTQSLLAFSRKQAIELKPKKVNAIIRESERLLKRLLTEDIEFKLTLISSDPIIKADAIQMDQVLMNLATNARDAMPKGGKFVIETGVVHLDNEFSQIHGFGEPGDYAVIFVSDTGIGMDQETRDKIFEPFFTTKEVGKGTGLGLSTAYGIIKQHDGYITVSSEPAKGTTFTIYLPIVKEQAQKTARHAPRDIKGGTETILVAEDNDDVRRLTKGVLEGRGYTVIEATDGDDAVRQFMKHKVETALLIFDVVMPRKNGKETYEEIRKLRPDVKIIFTSGHTGDVILTKGISGEKINFIPKPLLPNDLLAKVREVLDK